MQLRALKACRETLKLVSVSKAGTRRPINQLGDVTVPALMLGEMRSASGSSHLTFFQRSLCQLLRANTPGIWSSAACWLVGANHSSGSCVLLPFVGWKSDATWSNTWTEYFHFKLAGSEWEVNKHDSGSGVKLWLTLQYLPCFIWCWRGVESCLNSHQLSGLWSAGGCLGWLRLHNKSLQVTFFLVLPCVSNRKRRAVQQTQCLLQLLAKSRNVESKIFLHF